MVMVPSCSEGKTKESAVADIFMAVNKYKKSQLEKETYRLRVDADYENNANNYGCIFNLKLKNTYFGKSQDRR